MNVNEEQAQVILRLLNVSWNDGFLTEDEKALLFEIVIHFPRLRSEFTELMLRGTRR